MTPSTTKTQKFSLASSFDAADFQPEAYFKRTCRNHYWLGGAKGQEAVRSLKIGVAGMGGMGSNIAELLTRLGVGHLRIADPDHIESSNLNRQVIANLNTVGVSKVEASRRELRNIAKDFELVSYNQGVIEEMVDEFVSGCDAIVDEIDVFPLGAHVMLHRAARKQNIPLYSAYAVGYGTHFYKFHGEEYTFEKFLGPDQNKWKNPTSEYLLDLFGPPYASYFSKKVIQGFADEIATGGAPIFGPTTCFGQSLVVTRLILDLLNAKLGAGHGELPGKVPTPVMPEFLVLDPCDMTFKVSRVSDPAKR